MEGILCTRYVEDAAHGWNPFLSCVTLCNGRTTYLHVILSVVLLSHAAELRPKVHLKEAGIFLPEASLVDLRSDRIRLCLVRTISAYQATSIYQKAGLPEDRVVNAGLV